MDKLQTKLYEMENPDELSGFVNNFLGYISKKVSGIRFVGRHVMQERQNLLANVKPELGNCLYSNKEEVRHGLNRLEDLPEDLIGTIKESWGTAKNVTPREAFGILTDYGRELNGLRPVSSKYEIFECLDEGIEFHRFNFLYTQGICDADYNLEFIVPKL